MTHTEYDKAIGILLTADLRPSELQAKLLMLERERKWDELCKTAPSADEDLS